MRSTIVFPTPVECDIGNLLTKFLHLFEYNSDAIRMSGGNMHAEEP